MRVLIVDDHPLYLDAARQHLCRAFRKPDVQTFTALNEGLASLASAGADLLMLDYSLPGIHGTDGLERVISVAGSTPIIIMSGVAPARDVLACIAAGARGFLPKTVEGRIFTDAVSLVLNGGTYLPTELMTELAAVSVVKEMRRDTPAAFSLRERQLLTLIAGGASNKEIARQLELQEVTVKFHLTRLYRRLGVKNRSQVAVAAIRMGLVDGKIDRQDSTMDE